MRDFIIALVGAIASFGYWSVVAMLGFTLGSGDVAPNAPPPPASSLQFRIVAVTAVAVVVYALLTLAWNRVLGPRPPTSPSA